MTTSNSFAILFWISKSRAKNGKAPIYCRISINGKRAELASKRSIELEKWNSAAGTVKGTSEEARTINTYLNMLKTELYNKYNLLLAKGEFITPDKLKNEFLGVAVKERTLIDVFKYHNKKMEERIGIDIVKPTHTKFETILSKVQAYLKDNYKVRDMYLKELDHQFIVGFEHYLRVEEKIGNNTTMKYIQNFKKIINLSIANSWLDRNPFMNFKCSFKNVNRESLSPGEIYKLENKVFAVDRVEQVRDIFLFCCYTGLSFIDVQQLRMDQLSPGIDGNLWLHTFRQKTGIKSNVPLLKQAEALVRKYEGAKYREVSGKVFNVKSNQKMNAYLKEIADLCEINKPLTMHIARHTFATTITLSNGVPIETVSLMLGHTKLATTQIYAKVIETKVSEDMFNLNLRLAENEQKRQNEEQINLQKVQISK